VDWAERLSEPFRKAISYLEMVQSSLRSIEDRSPGEILSDIDILDSVRDLEKKVKQESQHLKTIYGDRFSGLQTDWSDILTALEWAKRIKEHFKTQPILEKFIQKAEAGNKAAPNVIPLKEKIASFQNLFAQFEKHFAGGYPRFGKVFLRECTHEIQLGRLAEMKQRIGEIQDWVDYTNLREDFQNCGLSILFQEIVKRPLKPERLPEIVSKSILQAWTDDIFKKKPALGRFRSQDHEALISEFKALDRKHWEFGAFRVISEANKRKPRGGILVPGGEEKVLLREAYKQKRHLPIRRLFGQIPNLLPRLKPCLLMSPLSVSQFLDPLQMKFDLVIFDEASQIRTEDAVGAIYRGQQLVICGDNRQLPPTAFFEQGMSEEYEDQGVEDAFDVFPSILDECASIGISQGWLRWHYRSKHESLIAFSNNQFYGNNLVTFPASNIEDPRLGIELRYLSDGTYDRSGKRDNPREAGKVVEIILNHFLTHPDRSLGVVAFSIAQMIAIEDRVERLIRERPEVQNYLKEDRLEGFFVKNLENVQGDERDVMIFSVGYGKDASGKIDMRMFGPLTRAGGERRLNVAVTRAREKVILVCSIRSSELDLSGTHAPGVLALHGYLDYAERGIGALLYPHGKEGEPESPFEKEVAAEIRALGHSVLHQVGCSGFRIDIGVVDPAKPGRFILGVECDGATYHSANTASVTSHLICRI
jgi:hypothetical protein